jgi:hypothetical protein
MRACGWHLHSLSYFNVTIVITQHLLAPASRRMSAASEDA